MSSYEPKLLVFCCNWCSYAGADLAGTEATKELQELGPNKLFDAQRHANGETAQQ